MLENIIQIGVSKLSNNLLFVLLTGATLTTSGVAGAKLYSQYTDQTQNEAIEVPQANEIQPESAPVTTEVNSITTTTVNSTGTTHPESTTQPTATPKTSVQFPVVAVSPTTTPGQTSGSTTASCIITIFGKNYDVQPLRSTHSGGDVFTCGTDMSATYQGKHGTNVSRLTAYATTADITSSNPGSGTTSSGSTSSNTSFRREEEREDEEYEEEQENRYEREQDEREIEREESDEIDD